MGSGIDLVFNAQLCGNVFALLVYSLHGVGLRFLIHLREALLQQGAVCCRVELAVVGCLVCGHEHLAVILNASLVVPQLVKEKVGHLF